MTSEERNSIQEVLNKFRSHKLYSRPDWRLQATEEQRRPLESVQELYAYYQQTKSLVLVGEKYNIGFRIVHKLFKRYNLELFGSKTHRSPYEVGTKKPSTKHMDTLSLSQSQWNRKYHTQSKSLYYKLKKVATKFVGTKS